MATPSDTALRRWALVLFAVIVAFDVVFIVCARAVAGDPGLTYPDDGPDLGDVVGIVVAGLVGLVVIWMRPRNPVGWLLAASGLFLAMCNAGQEYGALAVVGDQDLPLGTWALALSAPLWIPALLIGPAFLLVRYPSGRIDGRWPRRFDRLALGGLVLLCLGYAAHDNAVTDMVAEAESPFGVPTVAADLVATAGAAAVVIALLVIVGDAIRRLVRERDRSERIALALLFGTAVAAGLLAFFGPAEWMLTVAWFGVMVAIATGVLRYGALGIEVTVSTGGGNDPFAALNRLGEPLGGDVDERSLAGVLEALRDGLEVDGVAVDGPVAALTGTLPEEPTRIPLQFAGTDVGVLLIGDRAGRLGIGRTGQRLVEAVSPLIAAVLHAVQVAEQLRGHQQRVVAATQAERVRLRQELHDGLGPALTGIGLGLEALATRVPGGDEDLVARLRTEVAGSLEETRRIIDDLRPLALDEGDLAAALRRRAEQLQASGLEVVVELPEAPLALPAPVAAALFRIAEEALTNVVRHAGARRCRLSLRVDDQVVLEIQDDGVGPGNGREGGVGISSMRDRAERLGGRFELGQAEPGTVVRAVFPLVVAP
ncbi:MAG: sensor histidine kinase [Aeromicrobium sp.]